MGWLASGFAKVVPHGKGNIVATQNADRVRALIEAVNKGDGEQALSFFHPNIVHHDPFTPAGAENLRQHIVALAAKRSQVRVVRLLEDGDMVMAQLGSEQAAQDRFAAYRFEDGKIAEQWAFFSPTAPPNVSGHTQLDGPTEPQHLDSTEANKTFVREYYQTFHLAGYRDHNDEFFTGDVMIRHEPGVQDGLGNFLHDVEHLMQRRTIDRIRLLIGQGDLVFLAATGTHEGKPCLYIDLYRVENRRLVEHWGFPQMVPPDAERLNSNPML